jgi:UDP-3-O-[3-hydroxymyristoyl] N-acetylglucosamine deacetylase
MLALSIPYDRGNNEMIRYQRTIKQEINFEGIGLHSGKPVTMKLRPAPADNGIVFVRTDLEGAEIKAVAANTAATIYATTLRRNGAAVQTVEHLLAALGGLGIGNVYVELDAEEVPILDGSAGPFIRMIAKAGLHTQKKVQPVLKVTRPLFVRDGGKQLAIWPAESTAISFSIEFKHPLVREQSITYRVSEDNFIREIADARTFGFLRDVEALQANGLAKGGSLANAVVLGDEAILNEEGLRYHDEFVRHKVLDIIGDLALVGMPVIGHVVAHKSGHSLNAQMVERLLQSPTNWVLFGDPEKVAPSRERIALQEIWAM